MICTFGTHSIHQRANITEGGIFVGIGIGLIVRQGGSPEAATTRWP